MNYQTADQLTQMKLHAMRTEYARQEELPASEELDFDDRLGMFFASIKSQKLQAKMENIASPFWRMLQAAD